MDPTKQRAALRPLIGALKARANALRRDECGDWLINGWVGHIYAVPEGFQIMVMGCETVRQWTNAKKVLAFATVTQNGDSEGGLILDRLPTPDEADAIRHYCGVPKKREVGEEELARLRRRAAEHSFQAKKPPPEGEPASTMAVALLRSMVGESTSESDPSFP
jgi:hypothetical protein